MVLTGKQKLEREQKTEGGSSIKNTAQTYGIGKKWHSAKLDKYIKRVLIQAVAYKS